VRCNFLQRFTTRSDAHQSNRLVLKLGRGELRRTDGSKISKMPDLLATPTVLPGLRQVNGLLCLTYVKASFEI
jgi:hypothetical protein